MPRRFIEKQAARWVAAGGGGVAAVGGGERVLDRWSPTSRSSWPGRALRLHPSALLTPMLVVLAGDLSRAHPLRAQAPLAALQTVHLAQPDAGQASATGAAALVFALTSLPGNARVVAALAHLAFLGAAWAMPDPLPPAPFVEDIVARSLALGLPTAAAAVLSLVTLVASPFVRPRSGVDVGPTGGALAACFAASIAATTVGEFPVPLLGFGPSAVVGAFLGLAALRRLRESATTSAEATAIASD